MFEELFAFVLPTVSLIVAILALSNAISVRRDILDP